MALPEPDIIYTPSSEAEVPVIRSERRTEITTCRKTGSANLILTILVTRRYAWTAV